MLFVDELAPSDHHRPAVDLRPHPVPGDGGERIGGRYRQPALVCSGNDRRTDGVFGARFDRGGEPQHLIRLAPLAGNHIGHPHPGAGEGAGLVEHHGVDLLRRFQHLASLDQDPQFGAPAGADHDGRGGSQAQRTRARDDQHRDRGGHTSHRVGGDQCPSRKGRDGNADDGRDKHRRNPVGQPLHRRLVALCLLDQSHNLRQRGVCPDGGGAHGQQPVEVDRCAGNAVTRRLLDRDGFAGEHRLVDGGAPIGDLTVDRDLLSGPHPHQVSDLDLIDRHQELLAVDKQRGFLGAQLQQLADRLGRFSGCSGLEMAAQHHERDDQRRGVEEQRSTGKQLIRGVDKRGQRTQRDQRVHVRGQRPRLLHRPPQNRPPGHELHRQRRGEGQPPRPRVSTEEH
ncbi:Uncharacterised protein [Mycobacterium tuberculosis]|nr:Uncharacterised protein [Mycobacterium tuberculosis]